MFSLPRGLAVLAGRSEPKKNTAKNQIQYTQTFLALLGPAPGASGILMVGLWPRLGLSARQLL